MAHRPDWTELRIQVSFPLHHRLAQRAGALGWSMRSCATEALKDLAQAESITLDGESGLEVSRGPTWSAAEPSVWVTYPRSWLPGIKALMAHAGCFHKSELWRRALERWVDKPLPARVAAANDGDEPAKAPESHAKAG